nr:uncharacterized protein LOC111421855 [Onthophagus taurus]
MPDYHKNFFSANNRMLKIAGLWWLFNKDPKTKLFHYIIMGFYFISCQLFRTYHNIFDIWIVYGDLQRLLDHLGVVMSHILMNLKYIILYYRNKVIKVMEELKKEGYDYESIADYNPYQISVDRKRIAIRGILAFFTTVCSVPLVGTITSVTLLTIQENVTCVEILPDPTRVRLRMESYFDCCVAIIFQGTPVLMFGWQIVVIDNLYVVILVCLESHILIVKGAFETIRTRALRKLNLTENNLENNKHSLDRLMEHEMKRLSKHLQLIIRLFEQIEEIFNIIVLMQVVVVMALGVCSLYMMSSLNIISGAFLHQLLYFMAVSIQVTLYCWIGNEITLTGATVPLAIYKSDWITATSSFRKGMLINMARMQRNLCITIGKFSPLTLATLVAIFRGSYSYFAVLRNQKMRE